MGLRYMLLRQALKALSTIKSGGIYPLWLARTAIRRFEALQRTCELALAVKLVSSIKPRVIVEIGSFKGGTLFCWSRVADPNAFLIAVDLPNSNQMTKYGYMTTTLDI